jgi:hypothetical protein
MDAGYGSVKPDGFNHLRKLKLAWLFKCLKKTMDLKYNSMLNYNIIIMVMVIVVIIQVTLFKYLRNYQHETWNPCLQWQGAVVRQEA